MRLSIFNFRTPADAFPWAPFWFVCLTLSGILLAVLEFHLQKHGVHPSITDDVKLWSINRGRVYGDNPQHSIALLGASRMQLDIDLPTMTTLMPNKTIVQLAVDGSSPLPTLRDLAADAAFNGIAICDIAIDQLAIAPNGDQQKYVEYFHTNFNLNAELNKLADVQLQTYFAFAANTKTTADIFLTFFTSHVPPSTYITTRPDRSRSADYSRIVIAYLRDTRFRSSKAQYQRHPIPTPENWLIQAQQIEPWIHKIKSRGGDVVIVYLPTSSPLSELDEHYYPKTSYWDRFAAKTQAKTLHFLDVPALKSFKAPDGSHLDAHDTSAFTTALVTELKSRRFITEDQ